MELDFHLLDLKYEAIKGRNRKTESHLLSSLIEHGQLSLIIVLPSRSEPLSYVVIDGFKRIRALKRAGHDTVKAVIWPEDEINALIAINHLQRSDDRTALDDAYLIKALRDYHGLSCLDIGRRLGRSKSWVSRRLGLISDLPVWIQDLVREGVLQCYAATKYILPLARANPHHSKKFLKTIRSLGLSTRDIGELYLTWRDGDNKARDLVINQPQVVLRARRMAKTELAEKDLKTEFFKCMETLRSLSHQAHQGLDKRSIIELKPSDIERINQLFGDIFNNINSINLNNQKAVLPNEEARITSSHSRDA